MDSMRNLRKVLPSTGTRRQASQPPEQLLHAFKQAALSVTTLYKAAASEQAQAYQEGYRDALEEILRFLDSENIGLQDGEGWRTRQWATERFRGVDGNSNNGSDSEEEVDEEKRARSSSPVTLKKPTEVLQPLPHHLQNKAADASVPARPESAPPATAVPPPMGPSEKGHQTSFAVPAADFDFRSTRQMPLNSDMDMDTADAQLGTSNAQHNSHTVQVNIIPRTSRPNARRGNSTPKTGNRARSNAAGLGPGAGQKRSAIELFWDISEMNDKDTTQPGGGKRSRLS